MQRRDAVSGKRDFDDAGHEGRARGGGEVVAAERAFDRSGGGEAGLDEGVDDGEDAEDGERDPDEGDDVRSVGHGWSFLISERSGWAAEGDSLLRRPGYAMVSYTLADVGTKSTPDYRVGNLGGFNPHW